MVSVLDGKSITQAKVTDSIRHSVKTHILKASSDSSYVQDQMTRKQKLSENLNGRKIGILSNFIERNELKSALSTSPETTEKCVTSVTESSSKSSENDGSILSSLKALSEIDVNNTLTKVTDRELTQIK